MDTQWITKIVIFGILHWMLALLLLQDLAYRGRVLGGKKWPWALPFVHNPLGSFLSTVPILRK
jgi:hypothetical protein